MAKLPDLRALKDKAAKAVEKRSYVKAAEIYLEILQHEDDPDWRQRAGEALRKAAKGPEAVEQFILAAEGYAKGGFLLKAVAVCKVVLQIDARHTSTQKMLGELYAIRDGSTRSNSGQVELVGAFAPGRPAAPQLEVVAPSIAIEPEPAPTPTPMEELSEPSLLPRTEIPLGDGERDMVSLDDLRPKRATIPPGSPMDVLPLATMLGGRRSQQFPAVKPEDYGGQLDGDAYEISLDDSPAIEVEPPRLDPLPMGDSGPIELTIEAEPTRTPAPIPLAVRAPVPPAASLDELDFSSVMEDAPPAPAPAPPPELPRSPLFSSLTAAELTHVIEGMEVREFETGETVVRQGDRGVALYVIVRGQVEVVLEGPPRREVATLTEGAFFGELALLTDFPRSATVVAQEPTQLLEISRDLIASVIASSPDVLKVLLRFFRDRMLDRLLTTSQLFTAFSAEDARGLVQRFKFLELEPKMRVIREGERAPGLFLLLCGEAHVVQGHKRIAQITPGDLFGEMSMLTRGKAMASIDTETKCWALELPREDFQEIMLTYPQLLELVSGIADKRREQNLGDGRVEFL